METRTLIIIYILLLVITIILVIAKKTHWSSLIGVALFPIYFLWVLFDLGRSSSETSEDQKMVDAMMGICVHNPNILLEAPKDVRNTANESLMKHMEGASLSSKAKTAYVIAQGALSFDDSEKQATNDLPEQMNQFMSQNGFDPAEYEVQNFSEELRADIKVLWAAAIRKS